MIPAFLFSSIMAAFAASPTIDFQTVLNNAPADEIAFATQNDITDWNSYEEHMQLNATSYVQNESGSPSASLPILNLSEYLDAYYPDYSWHRNDGKSHDTSEVSNAIPIEMKTIGGYSVAELNQAIIQAGVQNETDYGGCGPIAIIGMLDYFARYLGYSEIIGDPTSAAQRIALATEVMSNTHYSIFGSVENSKVWPWDAVNAFNAITLDRDLSIQADYKVSMFGGRGSEFWDDIVTNIDEGIPVTMFTGGASGSGSFADHYTNVYGYETWVGIPINGGDRLTKTFLKARLNLDETTDRYCDSAILDYIYSGILTYDMHYDECYSFSASDFAEEFVNDSGGGQYFFSPISEPVSLTNGMTLQTARLRTGYIENQYLVMSPNRQGAGLAYLDISFPTKASRISFDIAAWSFNEGMTQETLTIQYYDNGWHDHVVIDPDRISDKSNPDTRIVLLPKDSVRIRFYAIHSSPSGDRNKGRICLNNFEVRYHSEQTEA